MAVAECERLHTQRSGFSGKHAQSQSSFHVFLHLYILHYRYSICKTMDKDKHGDMDPAFGVHWSEQAGKKISPLDQWS